MTRFSIIEALASLLPLAALTSPSARPKRSGAGRTAGDIGALSGHLQRDLGLIDASGDFASRGGRFQIGYSNPSFDRIVFPRR